MCLFLVCLFINCFMAHGKVLHYKLPTVDVVRLVPQIPKEQLSTFRKTPAGVHRLICGKVILFRKSDVQSNLESGTKLYSVHCLIEINSSGSAEQYIAVFSCSDLVCLSLNARSNNIILSIPSNLSQDVDEPLYGAVISQSTQVVFSSSGVKCSVYSHQPGSLLLYPSHIRAEHEKMTFELQPEEVQSALVGCASSVFGSSSSSGSGHAITSSSSMNNVLLVAPSGSGSTTISKYLSSLFNTSLTIVTFTSLVARRGPEYADVTLHDIIQCALVQQPVVIVLDDLSAIAPREVKSDEKNQSRVVQVLISLLQYAGQTSTKSIVSNNSCIVDALRGQSASKVMVVGITTALSSVDKKIVELFQNEGTVIHIPLPTAYNRRVIAQKVYQTCMKELSSVAAQPEVLSELELFSLADALLGQPTVSLVCSLTKTISELVNSSSSSGSSGGRIASALSPLEGISGTGDGLERLSDIAGHDAIKQRLIETVIRPRVHSALFKQFGVTHTDCGVLLFGPPGTGKTLLPSVLSAAFNIHIVNMKISSIVQGEVGSSERAVVAAFNEAKRVAPCIIFIDEFQALFTSRQGGAGSDKDETGSLLSSTLAQCLDDIRQWNLLNMESLVVVIGASNEPWAIDRSFLRSGRLSLSLFVGPLDRRGRVEYLQRRWSHACAAVMKQQKKQQQQSDAFVAKQELEWIQWTAERCEGFTGADMSLLWQRAVRALQEVGYHSQYRLSSEEGSQVSSGASGAATVGVKVAVVTDEDDDEEEEEEWKAAEGLSDLMQRIEALEDQYIRETTSVDTKQTSARDENSAVVRGDSSVVSLVYDSVPSAEHFVMALRSTKASVSPREIEEYLYWDKHERNK